MSNMNHERVLSVHHWNDTLFSFKCTRDPGLRFENGQFVMIGLQQDNGRPLMRAYSIASPNWEEHLEFFSIKVPDGPLTSQLRRSRLCRSRPDHRWGMGVHGVAQRGQHRRGCERLLRLSLGRQ